jgi:uncharacterized protein
MRQIYALGINKADWKIEMIGNFIEKNTMILQGIYIAPGGSGGRGVFTSLAIGRGTLIESSPVIVMTAADRRLLDQTLLHDYIFEWGENKDHCCMALGYVAVYNHSYQSNCEYEMDFENRLIAVKAIAAIMPGQELFVNYNGDWDDPKPVWFDTGKPW